MQLKSFIQDREAVSPVIGVILMVAITVILAAVIGTFVLGLGDQVGDTAPNANWDVQVEEDGNFDVTFTHNGGDSVAAEELIINKVDDGQESLVDSTEGVNDNYEAGDTLSAGDQIVANSVSDDVQLIWESGDTSSILITAEVND